MGRVGEGLTLLPPLLLFSLFFFFFFFFSVFKVKQGVVSLSLSLSLVIVVSLVNKKRITKFQSHKTKTPDLKSWHASLNSRLGRYIQ